MSQNNAQNQNLTTSTSSEPLTFEQKWAQAEGTVVQKQQKQDSKQSRDSVKRDIPIFPTNCSQRFFKGRRVWGYQLLSLEGLKPLTFLSIEAFDNSKVVGGVHPSVIFVAQVRNFRIGPAVTVHGEKESYQEPSFIEVKNPNFIFGSLPVNENGMDITRFEWKDISVITCWKNERQVNRSRRSTWRDEDLTDQEIDILAKGENYFLHEYEWPKGGMRLNQAKDIMIKAVLVEGEGVFDSTEDEGLLHIWANDTMNLLKKVWRETGIWEKEPTQR